MLNKLNCGIKLTHFKEGEFNNEEAVSDIVLKLGFKRLELHFFKGGVSIGVQNKKHAYSLDFLSNRPDLMKPDEYTVCYIPVSIQGKK